MTLHDKFGRQITDLRISITDRCNFRCVYCRSADPENYRDHDEILSWPELDRLAKIFLGLGIRKIRVTGGEPLVRDGVEDYVSRLQALGFPDLSMTTNGHLLAERCDRLLAAGLRRINISLDSLDPAKFERITRTKSFSKVMDGIDAVQNSRIAPAKVDRKSTRLNSSHGYISYAVFCLKKNVVLVADVDVEHAHFGVQAAEQQHRVPVAEEPSDAPRLARPRGEQHERDQQCMRQQQPVPARAVVGGERQDGDGGDRYVQQGDEIDGGEAPHDGTAPRRPGILGARRRGVV